ncbi:hypothetical protein PYK79_48580 [Streptomyces sp. ID05-04B]|uniref:hypothetical protein n=1 Tax=Streptomyces sp. ID05-04B TaxID=3028661 RepID=UPI0029C14206|nr:hypothetical protein [Streptomyces sp. ID05-04B]MDX5569559.1 hypothetical protein [Streptomyces sp. ID05-04B]
MGEGDGEARAAVARVEPGHAACAGRRAGEGVRRGELAEAVHVLERLPQVRDALEQPVTQP